MRALRTMEMIVICFLLLSTTAGVSERGGLVSGAETTGWLESMLVAFM